MPKYGFYSQKQKNVLSRNSSGKCIWLQPNGKRVEVTQVRDTKEPNPNFSDTIFLGEVTKNIQAFKLKS